MLWGFIKRFIEIYKAWNKLVSYLPDLEIFRDQLKAIKNSNKEDLLKIVDFFDVVSKQHDRIEELIEIRKILKSSRKKQRREVAELLGLLINHIIIAGRCKYGFNRTSKGERVTPDKVFLGNIFGLFTHPITYWLQPESKRKITSWGIWSLKDTSPYEVVSYQARSFMNEHWQMINIIDRIISIVSNKKEDIIIT